MAKRGSAALDAAFGALAHPVRRGMLERLVRGPATVGALADPYRLAAPTITRHLRVLEEAGLVVREKVGREHHVALRAEPLRTATSWLVRYRRFWTDRMEALDQLLAEPGEDRP